jgi:hypothetical protein
VVVQFREGKPNFDAFGRSRRRNIPCRVVQW